MEVNLTPRFPMPSTQTISEITGSIELVFGVAHQNRDNYNLEVEERYETIHPPLEVASRGFLLLGNYRSPDLALSRIYAGARPQQTVLRHVAELRLVREEPAKDLTVIQGDEVYTRSGRYRDTLAGRLLRGEPLNVEAMGLKLASDKYIEKFAERMQAIAKACLQEH